jgi:hypothetical protein
MGRSIFKELKMDNATARIIGGVYIAICTAMTDESAKLAHDVLFGFADNPEIRPEDRRVYRLIAESATRPVDELEEENARPRFEVITGGAA